MDEKIENALEILTKLSYECFQNREYEKAIVYVERYINLNPNNPIMYNLLGYLYQKLSKYGTLDEQIEYFEKSRLLKPDYSQAVRNLALTYQLVGRYEEAVEAFQALFDLEPVTDDYMAYGCLKIRLGDFQEGFKYYESRFLKNFGGTAYPKIDKPRWQGEDISEKALLVQSEQGFGDTFQFFRYLLQIKPLAKKIIFRAQNELADLIRLNSQGIEVVDMTTDLNDLEFDYHIPLMSLPLITKAKVDDIPLTEGYIKADEEKIQKYKAEYFNNDCFKIGISYSGSVIGNNSRNIPLRVFYPLTRLKNVKVYSFQKNSGSEQLKKVPKAFEIVDLGKTFNNFSDTAAAMSNIDLFVTSDNGVFNLAASMGKKPFLLLSQYAEWRWLLDSEKTPWYDSVKIFKKESESDDWSLLMSRVMEEISFT